MQHNIPNQLRWIEISKSALIHNITLIKNRLSKDTHLASIVKANAYGHGLKEVVSVIDSFSDAYGITELSDAKELRYFDPARAFNNDSVLNSDIEKPIINIGTTLPFHADEIVKLSITPVIYSIETAMALEKSAEFANKKINIVIKIETGMNRCGICGDELKEMISYLKTCKALSIVGFSTHFAQSDTKEKDATLAQIKNFNAIRDKYIKEGVNLNYSNAANTGAILRFPEAHYNMARCGIGLYGLAPSEYVKKDRNNNLIQALEYKSRVVQIHKVKKGSSVGYGGTWNSPKDATIAIIPVGYAEGYSRSLSNKGHVIIRGEKAPVVGRICMNYFAVDITNISTPQVDDEVILISNKIENQIMVDDIAHRSNTINYEVTTIIPKQIHKTLVE